MNTQFTSDKEQEHDPARIADPPDIQPIADTTLITSFRPSAEPAQPVSPATYYVQEDDNEASDSGASSAFASPFQLSSAMPVIGMDQGTGQGQGFTVTAPAPGAAFSQRAKKTSRSPLLKIALVVTAIVIALGFLWITVFAQPGQRLQTAPTAPMTTQQAPAPVPTAKSGPAVKPTPVPAPTTQPGPTNGGAQNGSWVPASLPAGWTNAGLTTGDGIFAERTAWAFTDREEGLDFRNIGTRAQHGGTMTAATFILTEGGKSRFAQNDVRVANNALFDTITTTQLVQAAVNAVPSLVKFQAQGQNQFAWVDVSYQLFQTRIDPNTGQRTQGLEIDPGTNQPRTHHMSVLLVRVTPGTQGINAPMGGSGWLVSNYGLDLPGGTTVDILQPV